MKETLESIFDIPFILETGMDEYPWTSISPAGEKGHMFSVRITNRSDVRLVLDFVPQAFSANLIRSMGTADDDKRELFCNAVRLMQARGATISMSINGQSINPSDAASWPSGDCSRIEFHANVILSDDVAGNRSLVTAKIKEWGCLTMGAFLFLVQIGLIGKDYSDQAVPNMPDTEGGKFTIVANRYERSIVNRLLCIAKRGCACAICGFDFEKQYGVVGHGYIHVHHVVPVSQLGPGYQIDPEHDLIPVCPNCHAMLHRKDPPYLPAELYQIIECRRHPVEYPTLCPKYRVAAERGNEKYGDDS